MLKAIINKLLYLFAVLSNERYIKYLRKKGILIGTGCIFRNRGTIRVDITRPSLISIGNNVDFKSSKTIQN